MLVNGLGVETFHLYKYIPLNDGYSIEVRLSGMNFELREGIEESGIDWIT
ncbi:hypothetical protein ACOJQI_21000 [Bacillus salacetis]